MRLEIVLDVACAWSYIGLTRYRRAADRLRAEGAAINTTFAPYQLDPDAPPEAEPLLVVLDRKLGRAAVEGTEDVADYARENDGLDLRYDRGVHSNTFEAHVLIRVATAQGRGEAMADRLFRAHFTDGLDVADLAVLALLATEVGVTYDPAGVDVDRRSVRAALEEVRGQGVRTIPVFRIAGEDVLTGAVSAVEIDDVMGRAAAN